MRGWLRTHRNFLVGGALLGLLAGVTVALFRPALYRASTIVLVSSGSSADLSQLRGLASQFGLAGALGGTGEQFPPELVAGLARSPFVLLPIVREPLLDSVRNAPGRTLVVLLKAKARGPADSPEEERKAVDAVRRLNRVIDVAVDRKTRSISLSVRSRWPEVSTAVVRRVVAALDSVIFDVARQRAAAERRSMEARIAPQERRLMDAEARVAEFVRGNREYRISPELTFEFERLQRVVQLQQQVLVSLVQSREQALSREMPSAPSLTVIEPVVQPVLPEPRRRAMILVFSVFAGMLIGGVLAHLRSLMA
ncbi:MAG: hypothetical protein K8S21_07505 [Gemmatimonadetes bacterium]|nr:hypothetical protein [Gemmatimonadota bacterium]